jgi:hypothetical protein
MYLFPYARFQPTAYIQTLGPLTQTWYVFPTEDNQLRSNFWDYATSGWIDNGIWIIPPGGYWEGRLRVDDPYTPYYLRVLPFQWRENTSYQSLLQVEVNGTLVQPSIDITGAIGWGQYWTTNPFAYYNLNTLLHRGENQIRLYWPQEQTENLDLQMLDVAPVATVNDEIQQAQETAQTELGDQGTATDNGSGTDEQSGTNGQ